MIGLVGKSRLLLHEAGPGLLLPQDQAANVLTGRRVDCRFEVQCGCVGVVVRKPSPMWGGDHFGCLMSCFLLPYTHIYP